MTYPLCEYAINRSNSVRVDVKCSITNRPCGMVRWCTIQRCVKMGDLYKKFDCPTKKQKKEKGGDK